MPVYIYIYIHVFVYILILCIPAKVNTAMIIKKRNDGNGGITVPFLSAEELLESKTFRVKRESNSDVVWGK
jgi:hypothetical protein